MPITEIRLDQSAFPEMKEVEALIRQTLSSTCGVLQEMVVHLLQARGKKLRPILVLLAAGLFDHDLAAKERGALLRVSAAVEMIHTASLVHDDIIDGALQRRGSATLHRRWNINKATLAGDFLLARAFLLLSRLEQNELLLPLMARSVALMCQGEIRQLDKRKIWNIDERSYFRFNYLKTSQFLAACCEAGGRMMAAADGELRALRHYGCNLGQAFQIVDDILDFTEDPGRLGKPVGSDLNQGIVTLPLIHLLRTRRRYLELLQAAVSRRASLSPDLQEQLREAVRNSGALNYAALKALRCKEAAVSALQLFPPTRSRHLLAQIAEVVAGKAPSVK